MPGTQLELASFVRDQGRLGEGVVLTLDDQMPAQYGKFARGGHGSDLHAATGLHPLVKRPQGTRSLGCRLGGLDQHAAGVEVHLPQQRHRRSPLIGRQVLVGQPGAALVAE